jgi:UPF0716 protein FxsA
MSEVALGIAPMSLVKWTLIGLVLLPVAELAAFVLAASVLGSIAAAGLIVATSLVGVMLLRRCGGGNLERLRTTVARDGLQAIRLDSPGAAPLLGGILLVFPGFITDIAGAALFIPALRRWLGTWLAQAWHAQRRRTRDRQVIDLAPTEWRQIPDQRPSGETKSPRRSRSKRKM